MKFDISFQKWHKHLLKQEAGITLNVSNKVWYSSGISNNPNDRGGLTNKGITWGTFTTLAPRFGISPLTKARFFRLSKSEHKEFTLYFWNLTNPKLFKSGRLVAFFAEEIWGGGQSTVKFYKRELAKIYKVNLGTSSTLDSKTVNFINSLPKKEAWQTLIALKEKRYRNIIISNPSQKVFERGWANRRNDFNQLFKNDIDNTLLYGGIILLLIAAIGGYYYYLKYYSK